jgi:hypothetical protein
MADIAEQKMTREQAVEKAKWLFTLFTIASSGALKRDSLGERQIKEHKDPLQQLMKEYKILPEELDPTNVYPLLTQELTEG